MRLHNTSINYGIIAKSLHWVVGLLVIGAWCVGYYAMDMLPDTATNKGTLIGLHKSVGMLILILLVLRLCWRLYDGVPKISTNNKVISTAALTVHYFLYVALFVQTLSGWAMSSAAGYPPNLFGWFTFPSLVAKNQSLSSTFFAMHNTTAWLLVVLLGLHVGGALFHHFILKDNTLRKMTVD